MKDAAASFQFKGIRYRDFNELEISGPNNFNIIIATKFIKLKVSNLPAGVNLKARVRAVNGRGHAEWSESVAFIVYAITQPVNNTPAE